MTTLNEGVFSVARTVWSTMLGIDIVQVDPDRPRPEGEETISACVSIEGTWDGAVLLRCSEHLARDQAARLFDVGADEVTTEEVHDALQELVNVAGGQVKAHLPGPSRLLLPVLARGRDYQVILPSCRPIEHVAFEVEGDLMDIIVFEREEPESSKG